MVEGRNLVAMESPVNEVGGDFIRRDDVFAAGDEKRK